MASLLSKLVCATRHHLWCLVLFRSLFVLKWLALIQIVCFFKAGVGSDTAFISSKVPASICAFPGIPNTRRLMDIQACAITGWSHFSSPSLPNFFLNCEEFLRLVNILSACVLEEGRGGFKCLFYNLDPHLSPEWLEYARNARSRSL